MSQAPEPAHPYACDLRTLLDQMAAGVALAEEVLDATAPGWDTPRRGRRSDPAGGQFGELDTVRGKLVTAWINLAHVLVRIPGVEPWSIPPLVTRNQSGPGVDVWQFGPDGGIDMSQEDGPPNRQRTPTTPPVRVVPQPTEPRYTLDQARRILQAEHGHTWSVVLDGDEPVAVRCTGTGCDETRTLS